MQSYYWGDKPTDDKPLRMAYLPVSFEVIEKLLQLPEGYRVVGLSYDNITRVMKVMLASDTFSEVQEGYELPRVDLLITVHTLPDHPGYRRYTTEIK